MFHAKMKRTNQSFLDSKFSSIPSHSPVISKKPTFSWQKGKQLMENERKIKLRKQLQNQNIRNSDARRSIAQTVQQANNTSFEFFKRTNRLVAKCKLIFLKLAYSSYIKLKSPMKKIRLLYSGVQKYSGTKIEQKIISTIKKRLNNNAVVFETLKLNFQSSLPKQSNRYRRSLNIAGDRTSFFEQIKSRNMKIEARNLSISIPSSSSAAQNQQKFNQTFSMFSNRR